MLWTSAFWKGAAERGIKTFAFTLAGVLGTDAIGILDADWGGALSVSAMATLLSFLTAVGNADFTAGVVKEDASLRLRG